MIPAKPEDKQVIVDILAKSFDENKSVNYVVKQDKKRTRRVRRLMNYSFELCRHSGEIYLSDDKKGVALLLLPHKKKISLWNIWNDLHLALGAIGVTRVAKVLKREAKISKYHPKEFIYVWYIGVEPGEQGKGIGSDLMKGIIDIGNQRQLPLYLETSTEKNLLFYERFNFKIYQELDFGHILYLFRKDPDFKT